MRTVSLLLSLAAAVLLCAVSRPATSHSQTQVDLNPFLTILPALRTAPAPNWVKPGTRLTYYSTAATVVRGLHRYEEDPSCTAAQVDCYVQEGTGKWFRQKAAPGAGRVSGHGYTQVNVVYLDHTVAVLEVRNYGFALGSGPPVILSLAGAVGLPGAGADFWLNPHVLWQAHHIFPPAAFSTLPF
jgi:hypothetical protein